MRLLVFTDLDGTLLDHDSYSWAAAKPALDALAERQVPVMIVTSKTAAEVTALRYELGNAAPFVVENGAAIIVPGGTFPDEAETREIVRGADREAILTALAEATQSDPLDAVGFTALGVDGIAAATGLTPAAARLANDRLASEPLLWRDSLERYDRLVEQLAPAGLRLTRGGRFVHVMGAHDKGDAVRWLTGRFRLAWPGEQFTTVALGDGPNDLGMLGAGDTAVVIRGHHDHPMPLGGHGRVIRTRDRGPSGWNEAVLGLLRDVVG
ncbi:MAG: HAD-IIB family hydrolase [Pseudomonadota bacterium]